MQRFRITTNNFPNWLATEIDFQPRIHIYICTYVICMYMCTYEGDFHVSQTDDHALMVGRCPLVTTLYPLGHFGSARSSSFVRIRAADGGGVGGGAVPPERRLRYGARNRERTKWYWNWFRNARRPAPLKSANVDVQNATLSVRSPTADSRVRQVDDDDDDDDDKVSQTAVSRRVPCASAPKARSDKWLRTG